MSKKKGWYTIFQFTPLREGRRTRRRHARRYPYFNSRPSARGDRLQHPSKPLFPISIHAPPRGATVQIGAGFLRGAISIHAPPRGATRADCHKNRFPRTISIHAPPRGATSPRIRGNGFRLISIHAPPRGATCRFACCFLAFCISIHAPPRGATCKGRSSPEAHQHFNSRPSARGDCTVRCGRCNPAYFNSRPSARGDSRRLPDCVTTVLFQFTPLREGRQQKICNFCKSFVQPLQISMA